MNGLWGYVIGAAVTGASLLFNQWHSDRREQKRIEHERTQAETAWQRSRVEEHERWEREDARRWVLDRRQASADLLGKINPWIGNLREWSFYSTYLTVPEALEEKMREIRDYDWVTAARIVMESWSTLEILASEQVGKAYRSLMYSLGNAQEIVGATIDEAEIKVRFTAVEQAHKQLLTAIRADLGVSGPSAPRPTGTPALPVSLDPASSGKPELPTPDA